MKKRLFSMLLSFCLMLTLIPSMTALATETDSKSVTLTEEAEGPINLQDHKPVTRAVLSQGQLRYVLVHNTITIVGCDSDATNITIPSQIGGIPVTSIPNSAFNDCKSLTSISIPSSVTTIGDEVFVGCSGLTNISVDANNPAYSSDEQGLLLDKSQTTLICCPGGKTTVNIPNSVTTIRQKTFLMCDNLTKVMIPDSVTFIGYGAFSGCSSLINVRIPSSVTTIGDYAFSSSGLMNILVDADNPEYFSDKQGLLLNKSRTTLICCPGGKSSVSIPISVTTIEKGVFSDCNSLNDVYYSGTEEQWNAVTVRDSDNDPLFKATIHYDSVGPEIPPLPSIYNISFDVNGGNVSIPSEQTDADGKLSSLPVLTRDGYTFDGWYTAQINGDEITKATVFSKDTTVYAHWTVIKMPEPVTTAPEFPKESISFDNDSAGTVTVRIPEIEALPGAQVPIQYVLCTFSNSGDASGPASEYKTDSVSEQGRTVKITPKNKNYRTIKIFTLDKDYRPICKPTIVPNPNF